MTLQGDRSTCVNNLLLCYVVTEQVSVAWRSSGARRLYVLRRCSSTARWVKVCQTLSACERAATWWRTRQRSRSRWQRSRQRSTQGQNVTTWCVLCMSHVWPCVLGFQLQWIKTIGRGRHKQTHSNIKQHFYAQF